MIYCYSLLSEKLRLHTSDQVRFILDNYCNSTRQLNKLTDDNHRSFADFRILLLSNQAHQENLLPLQDFTSLVTIAENLEKWIPKQPCGEH